MVFQKLIKLGVVSCLLGLGACAIQSDDGFIEGDPSSTAVEFKADSNACSPDMMGCENSDDYLTNRFSQTLTSSAIDTQDTEMTEDVVSLSRPAGHGTISVKEKQAQRQAKKDALIQENLKRGVSESEKVMYTTVAIPEELGTTEADASAPSGMVPLKKTTTTITETIKKVKPEKKDFRKMSLMEKIEYGQSQQDWEAKSGSTLRTLLMDWGNKSGWTIVWKLDRDYYLEAGVIFRGSFTEVAGALIRSFARATPAPIGTFHQGNRVLVINTQENENEH